MQLLLQTVPGSDVDGNIKMVRRVTQQSLDCLFYLDKNSFFVIMTLGELGDITFMARNVFQRQLGRLGGIFK